MVRKINNRLYKVNTYASAHIIEVDDNYDEELEYGNVRVYTDTMEFVNNK